MAGRLRPACRREHDHRRGHLRAGVAGGDERVGLARRPELEADDHRAVRLAAQRRRSGLSVISMTSGASTIVEAVARARAAPRARPRGASRSCALDDGGAPDELDACARDRARRGRAARRRRSPGGRSRPPWRPTRCAPRSGFPGCYSLLAGVVAALAAHVVRALHRLAARALLERDRGRGLVRVAGALLSLRGSSLRDGHGSER